MSLDLLTCPTDCTSVVPKVKFSDCAPNTIRGQINKVYIGNVGNPMVNWADPAEWASRIDNDDEGDATKIRELTVIGEKPKPDRSSVDISNGRKAYGTPDYKVSFTIDDNTDENYDWMRSTGCNGTFLIWFETLDGYLYGDNSGIKASIVADEVNTKDKNAFATIEGDILWSSKLAPLRMLSPIAH